MGQLQLPHTCMHRAILSFDTPHLNCIRSAKKHCVQERTAWYEHMEGAPELIFSHPISEALQTRCAQCRDACIEAASAQMTDAAQRPDHRNYSSQLRVTLLDKSKNSDNKELYSQPISCRARHAEKKRGTIKVYYMDRHTPDAKPSATLQRAPR